MGYVTRISGRDIVDADYTIEGSYIVEITGPTAVQGLGSGVCAVVGEFLKGPIDTPVEVFSSEDFKATFGTYSPYSNPGFDNVADADPIDPSTTGSVGDAGSIEGNGYYSVYGKKYPRLFVVNVDQSIATCTATIACSTDYALTIPAGTRFADADESNVFALCDDLVVASTDYTAHSAAFTTLRLRRVAGTATTVTLTQCLDTDAILTALEQSTSLLTITPSAISTITVLDQAEIESRYSDAIDLLDIDDPQINLINIVWVARHTAPIYTKLRTHCIDASSKNYAGRCYVCSPVIGETQATITGSSGVAVGNTSAARLDRCWFAWPGIKQSFPFDTVDTVREIPSDSSVAARIAALPPEYNPGMVDETAMPWVLGLEDSGKTLKKANYAALRSAGVIAINMDTVYGPTIQSGVTSSQVNGLKNIARRRMADYITGSLAQYAAAYKGKPYNTKNYNRLCNGVENWLFNLQKDQRIGGYISDYVTGNTAAKAAAGIAVLILKIRTLSSMDFITFQVEVGETVEITTR